MSTSRTEEACLRRARRGGCGKRHDHLGRLVPSVCLAAALFVLLSIPAFSSVSASVLSQKQAELKTARAQLSKLQASLDVLSDRFSNAEAKLAQTDDAITAVEKDIARSESDMGIVRAKLTARLVSLYKEGRSATPQYLEILFSESDFLRVIQRFSLLEKLADQDRRLFQQVQDHLSGRRERAATLAQKKRDQADQMVELKAAQADMYEKMKASSVEYRTLRKQVADLEEAARKAAEEAARRAALARQQAANNRSGGTVVTRSFIFPVDGPHSYSNTWGAPRSGGRTHKGTDIMAPKGTVLVACVSGTILRTNPTNSGLGGITVTLRGKDGTTYFYAHLDGIAKGIGPGTSVKAGRILGWVGDTGDAAPGAYHLHFEIRPGGGAAVNSYATLRAAD